MNYTNTTAIAATIACLANTAIAHGDPNKPHPHTDDLGTTTAVASRSVKDSSKITSTLDILDADALQNNGIGDFATALSYLPGSIISSNGGQQGTTQGIRVRGLHPRHTQVRVDGIRLTNRQFGLSSFTGQGSLIGYSRLELLQGPQSALYGSGATGGVVNLSTKKASDAPSRRIRIEAGSFNSLSINAERSGSLGKLNYYLFSRYSTTDNDTYGGNKEIPGADNDYINKTSGLRLDYLYNSDLELGLTLRISESAIEGPQFGGFRNDNEFILGTIYADYAVSENWQSKLTFSYLTEDTKFNPGGNNYQQLGVAWENALRYNEQGSISFGAEYENQDFTGFGAPNGKSDHYTALYLSHSYELQNLVIDTGVRFEDYKSFGSNTSWNTGFKYDIQPTGTTIKGNIGTGFNTPTLIQLFSPPLFGITGNPNLTPEDSLGWDIGVEQKIGQHKAAITFFETDVENTIIRDFGAGKFVNQPGKTKASGIEASLRGKLNEQVSYSSNYTWLDRSFNGQPTHVFNGQLIYKPTVKLMLGAGVQYLDQRKFGGNNLADALIVRMFGSYQLNDSLKLHARIENLTDTEYSTFNGFGADYPARRLGVHAGITYEW